MEEYNVNYLHSFVAPSDYIKKITKSKKGFVESFVEILENNVGKEYYEFLYAMYENFFSLIRGNARYHEVVNENNSYLDSYKLKVNELDEILLKYNKPLKSIYEDMIDVNYQENLDAMLEELTEAVNSASQIVREANEMIKPTVELEAEIKTLKESLKNYTKEINQIYKKLYNIGELKIFSNSCKEECREMFFQYATTDKNKIDEKLDKIFEYLWNQSINEANILNACANKAKEIAKKLKTGTEDISEADVEQANSCFAQFEQYGRELSIVADDDLLKNAN